MARNNRSTSISCSYKVKCLCRRNGIPSTYGSSSYHRIVLSASSLSFSSASPPFPERKQNNSIVAGVSSASVTASLEGALSVDKQQQQIQPSKAVYLSSKSPTAAGDENKNGLTSQTVRGPTAPHQELKIEQQYSSGISYGLDQLQKAGLDTPENKILLT